MLNYNVLYLLEEGKLLAYTVVFYDFEKLSYFSTANAVSFHKGLKGIFFYFFGNDSKQCRQPYHDSHHCVNFVNLALTSESCGEFPLRRGKKLFILFNVEVDFFFITTNPSYFQLPKY